MPAEKKFRFNLDKAKEFITNIDQSSIDELKERVIGSSSPLPQDIKDKMLKVNEQIKEAILDHTEKESSEPQEKPESDSPSVKTGPVSENQKPKADEKLAEEGRELLYKNLRSLNPDETVEKLIRDAEQATKKAKEYIKTQTNKRGFKLPVRVLREIALLQQPNHRTERKIQAGLAGLSGLAIILSLAALAKRK